MNSETTEKNKRVKVGFNVKKKIMVAILSTTLPTNQQQKKTYVVDSVDGWDRPLVPGWSVRVFR